MCGWTQTPYRAVVVENDTVRHLKANFLPVRMLSHSNGDSDAVEYFVDFSQL